MNHIKNINKKFISDLHKKEGKRGFTLLELLIVIGIIAILSVVLILVLNPTETLRKARDSQRMSDLNTLKTALGLIVTASTTPYLAPGNTTCLNNGGSSAKIYYSYPQSSSTCGPAYITPGNDASGTFAGLGTTGGSCASSANYALVDSTGWVPVNFGWMSGGSPISNLPIDPVNTIGTLTSATGTDYVYRYACQSTGTATKPSNVFEVNATLESAAYTSDDDKRAKDGGDSSTYYEVGTSLKLLPQWGI